MYIHIFAMKSMTLEEEIKQRKFKSELQKVVINILYTGNWIQYKHAKFFKKYSLSSQQFNLLRILRGQYPKPASVNLLIDRMLDKTSNASRLVDKLKTKSLVERKECATDRRQVDVIITQEGLNILEKIDNDMSEFNKDFNSITNEEAKELNRILDKLRG